jgi:hypothetical protein
MSMITVSRQLLDFDRQLNNDTGTSRLVILGRSIASGAKTCCAQFLAALHDSRRKQAAIDLAKHRHLIYDPDTGISFGTSRTTHRTTFAE